MDSGTAFTGGTGNDTFNSAYDVANTAHTLSGLDALDGGNGTDTLNITDSSGGQIDVSLPTSVKNIETVNVQTVNTLSGNAADISGWTGVNTANFTMKTATAQSVTVASGTAVTATNTLGNLTVIGGASQNVTAKGAATLSGSAGAVTATVSSAGTAQTKVDGGTSVNLTVTGLTADAASTDVLVGSVTAPTGAITVSASGTYTDAGGAGADDLTLGDISVTGGSTVSVTSSAGLTAAKITSALTATTNDTITLGAVSVTGGSATTAVTVTQDAALAVAQYVANTTDGKTGIVDGAVTIADKNAASGTAAGTLATVTLSNFGASTIDSSALTTVNLSGTGTTLGIGRGALTATPTANTLTLNVNGLTTTGAITDSEAAADDGFTTVNIVTSGSNSTINSLVAADATTLNVSGDKKLTLTGYTMAGLTSVTVGDGGVTMGTATLATGASFTSGAGADSVIIGATTKAIATGGGDDTVTLAAGTTALGGGGSIDAGAGTADVLSMAADDVTTASATTAFGDTISNFERIKLNAAGTGAVTVNLANLDNMNYVDVAADIGQTIAVSNATSGTTVNYTAAAGQTAATTITVTNAAASTTDVVNIGISSSAGRNINTVNAANVETINLLTDDTATTATGIQHTATVVDTAAKTITVTGDAGIALTQASTAITSFDASNVTAGAVSWTTGALAAASTIKGGAGNDTLDASLAVGAVTLTGGAGNDTLKGGTAADTISGGDGNDIIFGGALADTLTGGAGRDIFAVATVTDSNGTNSDSVTDFVSGTDFLSAGNHAIKYVGEASSYGTVLTSFTGVAYQAVMDTSTKTVYIDVNGDSALTAADISINVNVSDLSQTDFAILGTTGADAIALSTSVDTVYSLGGADTITAATNTATLGSISTASNGDTSISTAGMDIVNAVATATLNLTTPLGTDASYDVVTNTAAGGAISKTVTGTTVNLFHGLYDYATGTFTSTATTAANSASTTDVAAELLLFATADGTTADQGIVIIGATGTATALNGVITLV